MISTDLIRNARERAGLTQSELADRLGVTQAAIARLERRGANPTVATLERTMHATGHRLEIAAIPEKSSIDDTLVASTMRRTPAERLTGFESWYAQLQNMLRAASGDA